MFRFSATSSAAVIAGTFDDYSLVNKRIKRRCIDVIKELFASTAPSNIHSQKYSIFSSYRQFFAEYLNFAHWVLIKSAKHPYKWMRTKLCRLHAADISWCLMSRRLSQWEFINDCQIMLTYKNASARKYHYLFWHICCCINHCAIKTEKVTSKPDSKEHNENEYHA
jgi:hypothetical protein